MSRGRRSELMARIRGKKTLPETIVASLLPNLTRRLNDSSLPGTPDIVLTRLRSAILVHGCFWHRHACRAGRARPATNAAFWKAKFDANTRRDRRVLRNLRSLGWKVLVVWECQTKARNKDALLRRLD